MGILMGNYRFLPTAGQAGFSPIPTFPEGEVGKGNGAPGIPSGNGFPIGVTGNGKRETGNSCTLCGADGHRASQCPWGQA